MRLLFAALVIFASVSAAQAASRQPGGGGLGFSCDVNTQKCECAGVETGADCAAMKKNCGTNNLSCFKNLQYKDICVCNMAMKKRLPGTKGPKVKELAPQ